MGTVGLLITAMVVAAVLAYQAWDAARSHLRTAENTLLDYAKLADWQLTQQAKNKLLTQVATSLMRQASAVNPESLERSLLAPVDVEDVARQMVGWCRCLGGVQYFFRYDWSDGTFRTTDTDLPDADLAWARDTMVAYAKALGPVRDPEVLSFGSPDGGSGPFKNLAVVLRNDSYAMLFGERHKKSVLVVFVLARGVDSALPLVTYGYVTDPQPFLSPIFTNIRGAAGEATSLLPRAHRKTARRFDPVDLRHDADGARGLQVAGMGRGDVQCD